MGRRGNAPAQGVLLRAPGPVPLFQYGRGYPGGPQVFCGNSQELCTRPGSICLVAGCLEEFGGNRDLGAYYRLMAALLARQGWMVHVLLCCPNWTGTATGAWAGRLARTGISISMLD